MNLINKQYVIRKAKDDEDQFLTNLALRSKSFWEYDQNYLNESRSFLEMNKDYISTWPVYVLETKENIIGFYSLKNISNENRLDNFWIDLPYIRKGYGKVLLQHALITAKDLNWQTLRLAADPGAEKFYLKFGATRIGSLQSRVCQNLFFPYLEFAIL